MSSITSANAVLMMSIASLYPTPQQIQGFAVDDIYGIDDIDLTQEAMGCDGYFTAGRIFMPVPQTISLMADSPSNAFFEAWNAATQVQNDVYFANATLTLPGLQGGTINAKWTQTRGTLKRLPMAPSAGKTLKERKYTIVWQSVVGQPA